MSFSQYQDVWWLFNEDAPIQNALLKLATNSLCLSLLRISVHPKSNLQVVFDNPAFYFPALQISIEIIDDQDIYIDKLLDVLGNSHPIKKLILNIRQEYPLDIIQKFVDTCTFLTYFGCVLVPLQNEPEGAERMLGNIAEVDNYV
ncbi:hypothetical protein F5877DRAFT_72897 [Lentinula edodes]|nr:hypothetical protein F5877DRAFT_72897 [Lentinula edodes]